MVCATISPLLGPISILFHPPPDQKFILPTSKPPSCHPCPLPRQPSTLLPASADDGFRHAQAVWHMHYRCTLQHVCNTQSWHVGGCAITGTSSDCAVSSICCLLLFLVTFFFNEGLFYLLLCSLEVLFFYSYFFFQFHDYKFPRDVGIKTGKNVLNEQASE